MRYNVRNIPSHPDKVRKYLEKMGVNARFVEGAVISRLKSKKTIGKHKH